VETHESPVVSIQAWVSRGSIHENEKVAGISHFLEHALFKGTRRRGVGQIAKEIESHGGEINAFTSFEETVYYTTLASRFFEEGLDVIADAVQYPLFEEMEMEREKEVILEEIKRAQDSPGRLASQNLWKASFPNTPYGRPVLGFETTVKKITPATLKEYFRKNYHAGTLSLFVVGDIAARKVHEKVQKRFSKNERSRQRNGLHIEFPALQSFKTVLSHRDVQECHVNLGFLAPTITSRSLPALDLACSAIGQGESSRLYQRLVKERRLAMEVHLGLTATQHCGLATLGMLVTPENLNAALAEAMKVLGEVAEKDLEDTEIERVKSSLEAEVTYGKETVEGYARRLGYYYTEFGDPDYERKYLNSVLAVEKAETTQALSTLLKRKPVLSAVHPSSFALDQKALKSLFAVRSRTRSIKSSETAVDTLEKSSKGSLCFITKSLKSLPITAARILFLGGSREENKANYGLGSLFQRVWTSGTQSFTSLEIAHSLESLGASVSAFCGKNTFGLSIEFLSKHWTLVEPILKEILLHPTFPEHEFATERELQLREIVSQKDFPSHVCHLNFLAALYGDHPYGQSPLGTVETVSALQISNLKNYFKQFVHKKNMVISTVGNFHPEEWVNELFNICNLLPDNGKDPSPREKIVDNRQLKVITAKKDPLFQSHLLVGFLSASITDTERYPLKLLSSSLAGQGGRLFLELRDRQSLAYQVAPMCTDSPEAGIFGFYIGCSPEKLQRSLSGIRQEIEKILAKPLQKQELDRAKQYWIGRHELEMQRYPAQAMVFGLDEIYGLGYRHSLHVPELIKSITPEMIQRAAEKYLVPDYATISVVHPTDLAEESVPRAWR